MASDDTTKERLLFLRKTQSFGGADVVILDLLKGIDYDTNSVFLASSVDYFSKYLTELELPVICLPITASFSGGFLRVFISWMRYLKRLRPDKIILAEGGFREFALAPALAAFAVAPGNVWLMELHPAPEPTKENSKARWGFIPLGLRERARVWLTRGVVSVSHGVKDRLVQLYGYAPEKVNVVHHGVDTKRFVPASQETRRTLREDLRITNEAVVVVSTARLVRTKCLERLIQAFGVLSTKQNDLCLLLTGDGPQRDELERLSQGVPNCENISFLGNVPDVSYVLQASDIYVLPSNEEGFGIALVEAMACELVCVATKTVGASEIIDDGVNGFLTDLSYDGVLKGLERASRLGHKEREAFGRRARQKVLADFRVEEAVAKGLAFMQINPDTGTVQ